MRNCLGLTADDVKRHFIALWSYKYDAVTEYVAYPPLPFLAMSVCDTLAPFLKFCVCEIMIMIMTVE